MVCLGNICRSPLAEGILQAKADLKGIEVEVDSAGTSAFHVDQAPDNRSIEVAKKYQVDISNQRARQFSVNDFKAFDVIYAMDGSNLSDIVSLASNEDEISKVKLILNEISPSSNKPVPDPYYGGDEGFDNVYQLLDKASEQIIKNIVNGAG